MSNNGIFNDINQIKETTGLFISKMIEFYGYPDNDECVILEPNLLMQTFDGTVTVKRVEVINDNLVITDKNGKTYGLFGLPVEGVISLAYGLAAQNNISDMFDEIFSQTEDEIENN